MCTTYVYLHRSADKDDPTKTDIHPENIQLAHYVDTQLPTASQGKNGAEYLYLLPV